ncbi:phospholipase D-like domain-containing protein [Sphingobium algorifonticola]|uniref:Phospholipase D n=1 Tax=Sphingobium algorifonticola TaxID=2008318 RepID=A0A437J5I6_9SPHN|nr:phospholipase D-like domain-containing protein [Sphingobium algorifonticola]RVT40177.1 phospholipase [Sphingobium algorifonticola]
MADDASLSGSAPPSSGARRSALLTAGESCWRIAHADRFSLIVDADDYFAAARQAMLNAKRRIMLIGWDFDARIALCHPGASDEGPARLDDFMLWLVDRNPDLEICLLRWDVGMVKALFRGNTLFTLLRWKAHPRITARIDSVHPFAASHHQKIVAIDDCLAFCGGIDMTSERWDTRDHLDDNPDRVLPGGTTPYKPWHDATSLFDGDAAAAIGELARDRWQAACGQVLTPVADMKPQWPEALEPDLRGVDLAIARTYPEMPDRPAVLEIETLYERLIAGAKTLIYAESQYFASRRIAIAIGKRLQEPDGPEIVVINPHTADGWLEPIAMDTARAQLVAALRKVDTHNRLRIYHPQTAGGNPIYVHAKVTVIDDHVLRVGSSNFNNRSLRLDTECDVALDVADDPGQRATIAAIRDDLIAEHLGVDPAKVTQGYADSGSMITTIEKLRGPGRSLVPYEIPDLSDIEKWLADNEVLDPEGPEAIFEGFAKEGKVKRGLFRGWHKIHSWRTKRRMRRAS